MNKSQNRQEGGTRMGRHHTAVLGASGLVAQRMQQRLANHPWFRLSAVVGSKRTAGASLDSIPWGLEQDRPQLPDLEVLDADDDNLITHLKNKGITVAFSCVPSEVADPLERNLALAGIAVFSNSSAFRRCDGVPLVISDINPGHLADFGSKGYRLACATNCTLIPLAVPTAALNHAFPITNVRMRSEQALSGAGYGLLQSQSALEGNHPSEIPGEAEKTTAELLHVLCADFGVEVECRRVTRMNGHQIFAQVTFAESVTLEEVNEALDGHNFTQAILECPSAPLRSIQRVVNIDPEAHLWGNGVDFLSDPDPTHDLKAGMSVVMGPVRMVNSTTIEFSAYSHNTIRGAAGGTMLLAEQAYIEQRLPKQQ